MAGTSEPARLRRDSDAGGKRQAGRYVLGDLLGRGGMAEVFAGHSLGDHGFQKPVAIKRLLPELANDKVFVDRLIQEAKLLVGMTHGNVVSVIDLARDGEDVFLVMDFVDGPSLRQLLKARGTKPLPLGISSYIVQSSAAGLEFAHARPGGAIIHADISPSNLLLTTSGEVRVADFGIARREGGGWGVVEGKWAYMAPEQARGEPLTPRSDVFALGVVLYELITGAHPFGRQVTAEERESGQMRVIPPRIVKPSVPPGLDAICMRALAHDPRDRYARMQHMIDAIMDERFTNQWREGANDLAKLIGEAGPAVLQSGAHPVAPGGPRTMVTDRPVTLFTRSLIDLTPARGGRSSQPRVEPSRASHSQLSRSRSGSDDSGFAPSAGDSSVDTNESYSSSLSRSLSESASQGSASIIVEPQVTPAPPAAPPAAQAPQAAAMAKLLEMPNIYNPNGPAMPTWQLGANPPVAQQELESVHGGGTAASAHGSASIAAAPGDARSNKWTIAVLALAAVFGVVAAVVLQMRPSSADAKKTDAIAAAQPAPAAATPPAADPAPGVKPLDLSTPSSVSPPIAPATQTAPSTPTAPAVQTTPSAPATPGATAPATPGATSGAAAATSPGAAAATPPGAAAATSPGAVAATSPGATTTTPASGSPTPAGAAPGTAPTAPGATPPDALPKLSDPSTIAPDPDLVAKELAEKEKAAKAKESDKRRTSSARIAPARPTPPKSDRSERTERTERSERAEKPLPDKEVKGDVGFLRVNVWEWGWVSIDNGPKQSSPVRVRLPVGKHTVRVFTDNDSRVRSVEIEKDKVKVLSVDWDADKVRED